MKNARKRECARERREREYDRVCVCVHRCVMSCLQGLWRVGAFVVHFGGLAYALKPPCDVRRAADALRNALRWMGKATGGRQVLSLNSVTENDVYGPIRLTYKPEWVSSPLSLSPPSPPLLSHFSVYCKSFDSLIGMLII